LVILVAAIPRWVDLFEKWGVDAAGLVPYLEPLQEARWGIAALAVLWLLWILQSRFRAALARWEWARERYVRALVRLAGPVRTDVADALKADGVDALPEDVARDLRSVRISALRVLGIALPAYESYAPGPCWVSAKQAFYHAPDPFGADQIMAAWLPSALDMLNRGCQDLVRACLLSRYELKDAEGGAHLWLAARIVEANTTGEVSRFVRAELERRSS